MPKGTYTSLSRERLMVPSTQEDMERSLGGAIVLSHVSPGLNKKGGVAHCPSLQTA